eukprot:5213681-Alexandrium_andersonii.AAC.1
MGALCAVVVQTLGLPTKTMIEGVQGCELATPQYRKLKLQLRWRRETSLVIAQSRSSRGPRLYLHDRS